MTMIDDEAYSDFEYMLFLTLYENFLYQIIWYVELFVLSVVIAILLAQI